MYGTGGRNIQQAGIFETPTLFLDVSNKLDQITGFFSVSPFPRYCALAT